MSYSTAILSYYQCPDDAEKWVGLWDSGCDSQCPKCRASITPYLSVTCKELEDALTAVVGQKRRRM
jgi:hypothetical protein